jgi:hypothetical protein
MKKILLVLLIVFQAAFFLGCAASRKIDPLMQMRVGSVQRAMADIVWGLEMYRADYGEFPQKFQLLWDHCYITYSPNVEMNWSFRYFVDNGCVILVEATSSSAMPDGNGHKITYLVQEENWEGYGITEFP